MTRSLMLSGRNVNRSLSRRNDAVATEKASVVTARKSPRMRKAGRPTITDATAPTTPASSSVRVRSHW